MTVGERIRVLVLGDHPSDNWEGSSTIALQRLFVDAFNRNDRVTAQLFIPYRRRHFIRAIFAPLRPITVNSVPAITGGFLPLFFHVRRMSIVHAYLQRWYITVALLAARFFRREFLLTLHDTRFLLADPPTVFDRVKRVQLAMANGSFVLSPEDEGIVRAQFPAIPLHRIRHSIAPSARIPDRINNRRILFGGGLDNEHKGLNILEDALSMMSDPAELLICGPNFSGVQKSAYRGMVKRQAFLEMMQECRVVVVPSRYEPFSMVALEAMGAGIPVIVTDRCGIAEHLTDGKDAFIVPYGDRVALRSRIQILLENDETWESMRTAALLTVSQVFAPPVMVNEIGAVYTMHCTRKGDER